MFVKKYSQFFFVVSLILLLSLGYLFFFKISLDSLSKLELTGQVIFNNPEKELSKSFSLASFTIFSFMLWLIVEKKG